MKTRDAYILAAVAVIGLIGVFWVMLLTPKRDELRKADNEVSKQEQALSAARGQVEQYSQARLQFPRAYANVVRLGKAVPADLDMPSLIVQLEDAGRRAHVGFRKLSLVTSSAAPGTSSGASASAST